MGRGREAVHHPTRRGHDGQPHVGARPGRDWGRHHRRLGSHHSGGDGVLLADGVHGGLDDLAIGGSWDELLRGHLVQHHVVVVPVGVGHNGRRLRVEDRHAALEGLELEGRNVGGALGHVLGLWSRLV